jgi:hypothetical protein
MSAILALALTACGSDVPNQENRMPPRGPSDTATNDNSLAAEALSFGGIVLPPSAKVLAADTDRGIDQQYRLAVEVDPNSIDALLSGSTFTTPLEHGRKVFMPALHGFDPDNGTDIASAQDRLPPQGQRKNYVSREILVDRTNPAKPVIHLWLFTT